VDKRAHFLAQLVASLANLAEQFDAVLAYFTQNSAALAHCIRLLLDASALYDGAPAAVAAAGAAAAAAQTPPSLWLVALQVEVSNLLLLVSESNAEFTRALARLPAAFGGAAGVAAQLLAAVESPATGSSGLSPQVRAQCAGVLLNMQSPQMMLSLSSPASAALQLPGVAVAAGAPPVGPEQRALTGVLASLAALLDVEPLALGAQLVATLAADRAAVDARLGLIGAQRAAQEYAHKAASEAKHAAKLAQRAAAQGAGGAGAAMEDQEGDDDEHKGEEPHEGVNASAEVAADAAAANSEAAAAAAAAAVAAAAAANPALASAAAAAGGAADDSAMLFADEHDLDEASHKHSASVAASSGGVGSQTKAPEVGIDAEWGATLEARLATFRQHLLGARIALELLTNVASSPDMEDGGDESDSGGESDSESSGGLDPNKLGYIPKLLVHLGVLQKVVAKCQLRLEPDAAGAATTPAGQLYAQLSSLFPAEELGPRVLDLVSDLRARALGALNNLVLFLPASILSRVQGALPAIFEAGCVSIAGPLLPKFHNTNLSTPDAQAQAQQAAEEIAAWTGVMFQIARKDCSQIVVNKNVITVLLQLAKPPEAAAAAAASAAAASSSLSLAPQQQQLPSAASVAALALMAPLKRGVQLHSIGLLSLLGSRHPSAAPFHFVISSALLEVVKRASAGVSAASAAGPAALAQALHHSGQSGEASEIEVASEAIDGLVDLYSPDGAQVAAAMRALGLIPALETFLPLLSSAIRVLQAQRNPKVERQLVQRLQENALNAKEFVKYKKAQPQ
jgi:hypothetical protein